MKTHSIITTLLAVIAGLIFTGCQSPTVYFGYSRPGIGYVPATGGQAQVLKAESSPVDGLAGDSRARVLYLAEQTAIDWEGLDDDSVVTIMNTEGASCIALDEPHGRIYWGDDKASHLASCDRNGEDLKMLVKGMHFINVAVSPSRGWLFWSQESCPVTGPVSNYSRGVWRARLDGSGVTQLAKSEPIVGGLAVDESAGRIYWMRQGYNAVGETSIVTSEMDGQNVRTVVTGLDFVDDLACFDGWLYWPEHSTKKAGIRRVRTDGTSLMTVAELEPGNPARSVAVMSAAPTKPSGTR